MKLFVLTSNIQPSIFIKAEDRLKALTKWAEGFASPVEARQFSDHPSFKIREVTIPLLIELSPEQFKLDEDAGF